MPQDSLLNLPLDHYLVILLRLIFALVFGLLIGIERENQNQVAGLRTHMALCLGAAGIMLLSILVPLRYNEGVSDPGRIAAQVVSGIGFLGAGAIFRLGFSVKGLTTAASIWVTSGIGLMAGAGEYLLAAFSTLFLFIILRVVGYAEDRFFRKSSWRRLTLIFSPDLLSLKKVDAFLAERVQVKRASVTEKMDKNEISYVVYCRLPEKQDLRDILKEINKLGNIKRIEIE